MFHFYDLWIIIKSKTSIGGAFNFKTQQFNLGLSKFCKHFGGNIKNNPKMQMKVKNVSEWLLLLWLF